MIANVRSVSHVVFHAFWQPCSNLILSSGLSASTASLPSMILALESSVSGSFVPNPRLPTRSTSPMVYPISPCLQPYDESLKLDRDHLMIPHLNSLGKHCKLMHMQNLMHSTCGRLVSHLAPQIEHKTNPESCMKKGGVHPHAIYELMHA